MTAHDPPALPPFRIGEGWDVHALVPGRPLVLGGVTIAHTHGLLGHSDADALLHAITDALLGAAGLGDIGTLFPDSDARFAGEREESHQGESPHGPLAPAVAAVSSEVTTTAAIARRRIEMARGDVPTRELLNPKEASSLEPVISSGLSASPDERRSPARRLRNLLSQGAGRRFPRPAARRTRVGVGSSHVRPGATDSRRRHGHR